MTSYFTSSYFFTGFEFLLVDAFSFFLSLSLDSCFAYLTSLPFSLRTWLSYCSLSRFKPGLGYSFPEFYHSDRTYLR
jgi:hypothetical protein